MILPFLRRSPANSPEALNGELMAGVRDILRTSLGSGVSMRLSFTDKIVEIWALIAATLILAKTHASNPMTSLWGLLTFVGFVRFLFGVRTSK